MPVGAQGANARQGLGNQHQWTGCRQAPARPERPAQRRVPLEYLLHDAGGCRYPLAAAGAHGQFCRWGCAETHPPRLLRWGGQHLARHRPQRPVLPLRYRPERRRAPHNQRLSGFPPWCPPAPPPLSRPVLLPARPLSHRVRYVGHAATTVRRRGQGT